MSIGFIQGRVKYSDEKNLILLLESGIGYQIHYYRKCLISDELSLYVSHIFRENAQELFGHDSIDHKLMFELLISVKGVGPKSAYALVTQLGVETIVFAINNNEQKILQRAVGVGKRASEQIILDLKNKIKSFVPSVKIGTAKGKKENNPDKNLQENNLLKDTLDACLALGIDEADALKRAHLALSHNPNIVTSEELVYNVLKTLN